MLGAASCFCVVDPLLKFAQFPQLRGNYLYSLIELARQNFTDTAH